MYSYGPHHTDKQRQDNQIKPIYDSYVPIHDVAWGICRERWTIGTGDERRSGKTVLAVWYDDDSFKMKASTNYLKIHSGI